MKLYSFVILVTLFSTGMMGTRVVIPLVSNELGASTIGVGLIVSLFSILPLFFSIMIGKIIDKMNFKIPIYISIVLTGIGLILPFVFPHIVSIVISQLICGVSHTIFALSAQRFAGIAFGLEKRDIAIAQFSLGMALGSFIGPLLAGVLSDIFSYYAGFAILGVISLLSIFLVIKLNSTSNDSSRANKIDNNNPSVRNLLRNKQLRAAILISTIVLFAKEIFIAYFPLHANELGYSSTMIGFIVAIHTVAAILIRVFLGYLMERYKVGRLVMVSIIYSGIILIIFPFFDQIIMVTLLSFLLGLGLGLGQPLSITMTVHSLDPSHTGEGLGLRITFNRLTQVIAPITLGGIATVIGMTGVFWVTGILILGLQSLLVTKKY
ncbi:MFS transporter [Oceanobacillus bengalensis]|uniref:MFS transporter n=1 Tax=Oceanobacillus bengalensis TaxID=1435466 RepID=A0A494Z0N7_9BACI|nr:MFS transporter [Oceanobacillus bengalensis]RKQ15534.1 MFS transporter [Oceanobacillus bengalensis]